MQLDHAVFVCWLYVYELHKTGVKENDSTFDRPTLVMSDERITMKTALAAYVMDGPIEGRGIVSVL
jgi:hypothetical protein